MPKRNIYFSDELVAQMNKFRDENWSSVCQDGVAARLRFLELKSEATSGAVERAKARLANAKAAYVADAHERGVRAGMEWAADKATFEQLLRLHHAQSSEFRALDDFEDGDLIGIMVARVIEGAHPSEIHSTEINDDDVGWIQDLGGDIGVDPYDDGDADYVSGDFWQGFISGAISVYEQV